MAKDRGEVALILMSACLYLRIQRWRIRLATQAVGRRDRHPHQLALDDGVGVAVVVLVRRDAGGAEHHDQADGQQQRRGAEQQVVRRERPVERVAERGVPRATTLAPERRASGPRRAVLGVRDGHLVALPFVRQCCRSSVGGAPPRRTRRPGRRSW